MASTVSLMVSSVLSNEYANCIIFLCIGGCGRHRIVEFRHESLCELFEGSGLEERLDGQPIGMPMYCNQCLDGEILSRLLPGDLQRLVDGSVVDVVRHAKVCFITEQSNEEKERGTFGYVVYSADMFYDHRGLFTGPVYEIDCSTKELVLAEVDAFFGFDD